MIKPTAEALLLRLSSAAAWLTLVAVVAALLLPDPYRAVPETLRPGAWSQDALSAPVAVALLLTALGLRRGWANGWLVWAGLLGYLVYAYGLYAFDRVMNPVYPLYIAILSLASFALLMFFRAARPELLMVGQPAPPRRTVAVLFALLVVLFGALWLTELLPAMRAHQPLPGQTIFVLDLAYALPLTALTALLLWRRHPAGDLLAVPMLIKVASLGVSVLLGTWYAAALRGDGLPWGELALYALMGLGPALLVPAYLNRVVLMRHPTRLAPGHRLG